MATSDSIVAPVAVEPDASLPKSPLNVGAKLAALKRMSPAALRDKYAEVFGEPSRSGHKEWLIKRIIWRMQANAEGDLSQRARKLALEIANDADLRVKAPLEPKSESPDRTVTRKMQLNGGGVPAPGSLITREYKGQTLHVAVRDDGFEFEGEIYKSLSALAKKITGTHTSGFLFFRLGQYGGGR
ncbi:MAG: DUF2924 domain-containing protein [Planctomycetia bacterium]|nr:DUF2924 domain-containing protein [Planctomycetia bacterium]